MVSIIGRDSTSSEFALAGPPSLFSFRGTSGALQLRRAYYTDDLAAFSPHREKALISARTIQGPFLIVKLPRRENLPGACILRPPCFCGLSSPRAQQLCPVHIFWVPIRCRVAPGAPLFTAVNRRNFNTALKAIMAHLRAPDAQRCSSHGFRLRGTQELKETGSPWSAVATSGLWHSPSFRGYLDMSRDVELGAQKMFEVDIGVTSEQEG